MKLEHTLVTPKRNVILAVLLLVILQMHYSLNMGELSNHIKNISWMVKDKLIRDYSFMGLCGCMIATYGINWLVFLIQSKGQGALRILRCLMCLVVVWKFLWMCIIMSLTRGWQFLAFFRLLNSSTIWEKPSYSFHTGQPPGYLIKPRVLEDSWGKH